MYDAMMIRNMQSKTGDKHSLVSRKRGYYLLNPDVLLIYICVLYKYPP